MGDDRKWESWHLLYFGREKIMGNLIAIEFAIWVSSYNRFEDETLVKFAWPHCNEDKAL